MSIVDAHTHVHSLPGHMWDSPPERILKLMDDAGISRAIIMPYGEIMPDDLSLIDAMEAAAASSGGRLIPFARMHPGGGERGLEVFEKAVRERGHRGLKLHPVGSMIHPADPLTIALVERAVALDVPVLFHCGDEEWTLPRQIAKLLEKAPQAKVILGHMGGYFHSRDAIAVAREYPNCFLETSACPDPRVIAEAIESIGADRVIFGSDGPGCLPALEVQKIKLLGLDPASEDKIFRANIEGLIGGPRS